MREFPLEFRSRKPVLFAPEQPDTIRGDFLEIGPGNGEFLLHLAARYPDRRLVALELDRGRFHKLERKLKNRSLDNVLLICGDARIVVPRYLADCRFERIYVLFPDPWPKRRHAPHRLMSLQFCLMLADVLRPGGEIYVATDVRAYAEWVAENLIQVPALELRGFPFTNDNRIRDYQTTFFERVARDEGAEIHYLVAVRAGRDAGSGV